ncbi:hypothetical protein OSSY52_01290 [Tepiditoga spiralis]|uniref:ABC transmembrane type-1 domain-containing protein n=1 Tax=Tepiditoga spiralis TaxID=2108365 RepID=A0A7G1G1E5_9BACT|nr:ABC transporter permease [Tepiditoga spiralis]BBE29988.1 hypothetical protein OSSY52_01290 [Tepiditoga spiralis]
MNNEEIKRMLRKFYKNPSAMFGLFLLIGFIIIGILAPVLAPVSIPNDSDLEDISNYLANYTEDKKQDILDSFQSYYELSYDFYLTDYDTIMDLKDKLIKYKSNKLSKKDFSEFLLSLADEYIIDQSYVDQLNSGDKKVINELNSLVKTYETKKKEASKEKSRIEQLSNSKNFESDAHKIYNELYKSYVKSINFDPYLMPNVTLSSKPEPPSKDHPFGVSNGKDIYYGVIWGVRTGFKIGLIVVISGTIIGLFIGSISAYFGGWIDEVLMRITDIFMSIPFLLAAMVLTTILGTGLDKVMIALVVFGWMGTARLIRGNILQTKNEQYVLAAKALGVSDAKIIVKHILPNTIFPVVVQASMRIGSMVITAAGLSFLGVGAPQGYADWGSVLTYARDWMLGGGSNALQYWYTITYPGIAMVLFVLAWNLVGDALRDIFDPKLRM